MKNMISAFWRAAAYCLHPRVIVLSLMPLVLLAGTALALGYFFWEPVIAWTRSILESFTTLEVVWNWLDGQGLGSIKVVLVPLLVIFAATPLLVIACLLLVALMMAPAMVEMVATRRFLALEAKRGGSWWRSVWVSLGSTLVALVILIVSIPLWSIPPVILVLPPLIWGWLTYRVMTCDALSLHASPAESRQLVKAHRGPLLVMGLICGYLGAAPGLVWASGAVFVVFFPFLVPVAIWLYTLVFAFSSLWFTHYCLQALTDMRASAAEQETQVVEPLTPPEPGAESPAAILLPPD